jgi:hypothetical protein
VQLLLNLAITFPEMSLKLLYVLVLSLLIEKVLSVLFIALFDFLIQTFETGKFDSGGRFAFANAT